MQAYSNSPLVSIIIPCYNGARWIREAIASCQQQTYRNVEIVVIDDGSTDNSLEILRSYGTAIKVETGPNRGLGAAENRGFSLSTGEFIQYLDADDYLLPEKIERQVSVLIETGADAVYGDWRHQFHEVDGSTSLGPVMLAGASDDILEALIGGWWVPNLALLYRRQTVANSGGWDETLSAQNDHDFLISVALAGFNIRYEPGCESVYRRYGAVTMSTSNRSRWLANELTVLGKTEACLLRTGRLNAVYRQALARSYFRAARNYYDLDRARYQDLMKKVLALDPTFRPQESRLYNTAWRLFGFGAAEKMASLKRKRRLGLVK